MGVTGTLSSLGAFEKNQIMCGEYKIRQHTFMPSMYGIRDAQFDHGVHIEEGQASYHQKIMQEIKAEYDVGGAVIVFFESEEKLEQFGQSSYCQELKNQGVTVDTVTFRNADKTDWFVRSATRSKAVTLFPRIYGRGLDFVCYDKTVMLNGVYVLQTFLSADISEEEQIKGRTCRQGAKGKYKMVLLAEDITSWGETPVPTGGREQKHGNSENLGLNIDMKRLKAMQAVDKYAELDGKRRAWFSQQSQQRQQQVQAALERHQQSTAQQARMIRATSTDIIQSFDFLTRINTQPLPGSQGTGNFHVVFCLDQSGSMASLWSKLVEAFRAFIQIRLDAGAADVVSVVQFNDSANITLQAASLAQAMAAQLIFGGGGTNFSPALTKAAQLVKQNSLPYMLVFMSDGENGDGNVNSALLSLQQRCLQHCAGFQFHAVFLSDGNNDSLRLQVNNLFVFIGLICVHHVVCEFIF
jgi:Mg-chelatase subunit ChlD